MKQLQYILLILFSLSCFTKAQNLQLQKSNADSLFESEKFYDAITEYKRLLFFSNSEEYIYKANYNIAMCYKEGAKYNDAIKYLNIAKTNSKNVHDSINIELQIIRLNILRRTIPEALSKLNKLYDKYSDEIESSVINYWRGWAYLIGDDWESFKENLSWPAENPFYLYP